MTTSAPSSANARAAARPRPLLPPVTRTILPAKRGPLAIVSAAERLHEVRDDVLDVLEADRNAHGAVADAELGPLLGADAHVRRGRWMGHHALGVAQVVGDVDELQAIERLEGRPFAGLDVEGDDAAEVGHLPGRELVLRMIAAAGIEYAADRRIRG